MGDLVMPPIPIVRAVTRPVEIRDPGGDPNSLGTLFGYFSRFNTWYEVDSLWEGKFLEQVAPGAFKQTFKEDRDAFRILFDHGFDPTIGNKVLAPTRELREDAGEGAYYEGPLFDTSYNRDLVPGLRAGSYGASFRFRVREEKWNEEPPVSDHNPKGLPERTLTNLRAFEAGPVTFPASPTATAGIRSLTDDYYERLRTANVEKFAEAIRAVSRTRPGGQPIRRVSQRVSRAIGGTDAAALQALLARLAAADAAYDPIADALCSADEALDDALATVADLLGVANPDPPDADDPAAAGRSATDPTGDPATRSGGRGERVERSNSTTTAPPTGDADPQVLATADLALRQRHLLLRERGIVTK